MIWPLLQAAVLIGAHASPGAPVAPEADITVIARKLANTEGVIKTNVLTRSSKCEVEKSSGDLRVDDAVCRIAVTCLRQRLEGEAFRTCVLAGRERFLAELTERQAARQ